MRNQRTFSAKYGGTCRLCGKVFQRGTPIKGTGPYSHVACPQDEYREFRTNGAIENRLVQGEGRLARDGRDVIVSLVIDPRFVLVGGPRTIAIRVSTDEFRYFNTEG